MLLSPTEQLGAAHDPVEYASETPVVPCQLVLAGHVQHQVAGAQWAAECPDQSDRLGPTATIGRLGRLHALAGRQIDEVFARHGISTGEYDVLAALRRSGDPFRQLPSQLARALMLSPAGMTNRGDRLEASGHVRREADPDDRRTSYVVLTASGRELVDLVTDEHLDNETLLLAPLSERDRATLDRLLRTLLSQFDRPADD